MLRSFNSVSIALVVLCVSLPAVAEDDFSRSSCYVGLAYTLGVEDAVAGLGDSDSEVGESFAGIHGRVGCRAGWAAGELHFEWLDGFETEVNGQPDRFNGYSIGFDGKAYILQFLQMSSAIPEAMRFKLPSVVNRIQPYATLGFGYLEFSGPGDLDGWSFAARFGGGVDVWITREVSLGIDFSYVKPASAPISSLDYYSLSVGVAYMF